jgi:hypothetical protein
MPPRKRKRPARFLDPDDQPTPSDTNNPPAVDNSDNLSASGSSDNTSLSDSASASSSAAIDYDKLAAAILRQQASNDNSGVGGALTNTQTNVPNDARLTKNSKSAPAQPSTSTSTSSNQASGGVPSTSKHPVTHLGRLLRNSFQVSRWLPTVLPKHNPSPCQ